MLRYGVDKDPQGLEGGACHAFCSYLEVKRQIWMLSCAHHLQIIINLRNYLKNMQRKSIIYERLIDRAYAFKQTCSNPTSRIDSQLMDCNAKNFKFNSEVLPSIFEGVLL